MKSKGNLGLILMSTTSASLISLFYMLYRANNDLNIGKISIFVFLLSLFSAIMTYKIIYSLKHYK